MAYSYSCPTCDRKWPYKKPYSICPICRTTAQTSTVGIPMTDEAARFELKNLKFNAFYAKREAVREGPSPEEKGRAEADLIIELDRQLGKG